MLIRSDPEYLGRLPLPVVSQQFLQHRLRIRNPDLRPTQGRKTGERQPRAGMAWADRRAEVQLLVRPLIRRRHIAVKNRTLSPLEQLRPVHHQITKHLETTIATALILAEFGYLNPSVTDVKIELGSAHGMG